MENCLIKKLSSSVTDNTIAKVGSIVLEVVPVETPSAESRALYVRANGGFTINVIGDGYMSDNYDTLETDRLTTYTTTDNTEKILYVSNSNFYIEITNKYGLRQVTNYQAFAKSIIIDLARFKGCANLRQLSATKGVVKGDISVFSDMPGLQYLILSGAENAGVYGDIKSLAGKASLTRLSLPKNVYGDIANLASSTNLQYFGASLSKVTGDLSVLPNNKIRELNIQGSFIYGTLDELGKKITSQLTTLFLYDAATDRYTNGITGTIEGFVASAVNNNITNGTINARGLFNGLTTFGGTAYPAQVYTTLVWAGTSKIYIQDSMSTDKTIHCKGYSSSEIAEWQSQGYTVTDVTTGTVYPPTNS